jgi:type VI secretion system protein
LKEGIYFERFKVRIAKDLHEMAFRREGVLLSYSSKRAARFALLAGILLLGITSCGVKKNVTVRTRKLFGAEIEFHAHVAPNANLNNPVAVEMLLVYDDKLLDKLTKTNAKDWFMNRDQFRQDNPKGFDSWYWEWIPGQQVKDQKLPLKPSAKAALVFANYLVPGDNRAKLDPYKSVTVNLGERAFTATQE